MFPKLSQWPALALAFAVSLLISYFMTPPVKRFAEKIGAMDIPKDDRRVHDHPIPRMGGLAIIMGFVLSVLLFVPVSDKVYGIVIGSFLIAGMGFVDDIVSLKPSVKFGVQIFAVARKLDPKAREFMGYTPVIVKGVRLYKYCIGVSDSVEGARKHLPAIRKKYPDMKVYYVKDFEDIVSYIRKFAGKDDIVMTMGAGDVYKIGEMLLGK